MKNHISVDRLDQESARFTELAKGIAFDLLQNPYAPDVEKKKRLAQDHVIRAQTYRDAAALISKPHA